MDEGPGPKLPEEITRHYEEAGEAGRLDAGPGPLEAERTREIVRRYVPPPPAVVLDVGGAAGVYAFWLAERGHEVHLVDAMPRHVKEARLRSETSPHRLATCRVGDARALPFDEASADAVLLLGPLYHLTEPADRLLALREAHRVLRPGGVMFAAAISRWASALDGIARDLFADPSFWPIVERDLVDGQHRNTTGKLDYFTTAYFHRPDELRTEVESSGFVCRDVVGLEGPAWILPDFEERWADARKREDILRVACALEGVPSIIGLSAHMLAVGTKD